MNMPNYHKQNNNTLEPADTLLPNSLYNEFMEDIYKNIDKTPEEDIGVLLEQMFEYYK